MENITETRGDYVLSTDRAKMDRQVIHQFLSTEAYWSQNIPLPTVEMAIENSLNFGVFHEAQQVGYARIITDFATFAYLCDVFVLEAHRRQGLGDWLVQTVMTYPALQGLRRFMLMTRDAHALYARNGWRVLHNPDRCMEKHNPHIYQNPTL
jgi:GNAT superfamily N-acetyltransferase